MADIDVVDRDRPVIERTGFRLSWGGIFAGMLVATALHMVLALIGLAIGMDTWEPGDRVDVMGSRLGIWIVVSGIIALFIGGLVTGRLAGVLTRGDGALHGVVLWSVSTLLAAWLVASGLSTVVGGAFGVVTRTTTAAVGGLSGAVGELGRTAVQQAGGIDLQAAQRELERTLQQTGVPELQPDTLLSDAERVRQQAAGGASNEAVVQEVLSLIRERGGEVDRDAIVNVLTARTDMSRSEADRVVTRLETLAVNVAGEVEGTVETVGQEAEQTAETVAGTASDALAKASWWALVTLILSLAAAVGGATLKARD